MPSVPPAPARLSHTMDWPIWRATASNTGRATVSMALRGGNGVMSLIGCRVGHACPWALPADISPNSRTSARHELRRIAFSSGGRAVVRLVRADYVGEAGSTQIGNLTIGNPRASFRGACAAGEPGIHGHRWEAKRMRHLMDHFPPADWFADRSRSGAIKRLRPTGYALLRTVPGLRLVAI